MIKAPRAAVVATVIPVVMAKGGPLLARDMVGKLASVVGASRLTLSKVGDNLLVPDAPSPEEALPYRLPARRLPARCLSARKWLPARRLPGRNRLRLLTASPVVS